MPDEHQPRVIGFVSGRPDEQEEQKSNIENYYPINPEGYYSDKGVEFLSRNEINEDLGCGKLKCGDVIIIDDLTDLSGNREELAKRLLTPLKNGVKVEPVNKEHWELLKWKERRYGFLQYGEERALAGLKDDLAKTDTLKLK